MNDANTHWLQCSAEAHIGGTCVVECFDEGTFCTEDMNCCDGYYCDQETTFACQKKSETVEALLSANLDMP